MPGILADHDVEGHLTILITVWTSDDWRDLWESLRCGVHTFASLGIAQNTRDSQLWHYCQQHQLILLTGNRNADSEDSLEMTIQDHSQPSSLPVLTIADTDRVMFDKQYAAAAAIKVLEFLLDIENLRGTRRLFVP